MVKVKVNSSVCNEGQAMNIYGDVRRRGWLHVSLPAVNR
jgi:hypothetical protein